MRILVVDDNRLDRRNMCRLICQMDIDATPSEAPDVETAIASVAAEQFDCILISNRLNNLDGLPFVDRMVMRGAASFSSPIISLVRGPVDDAESNVNSTIVHEVLSTHKLTAKVLKVALLNTIQRHRVICIDKEHHAVQSAPDDEKYNPPKLLVVDDDPNLLSLYSILFQSLDVELKTASGGREALFLACKNRPDVIVTDYCMPNGNAEYLLLNLRQEPRFRETPVIVLTSWSIEGKLDIAHQRDMLGRFGGSAYLQKPLDFGHLVTELRRHCDIQTLAPT